MRLKIVITIFFLYLITGKGFGTEMYGYKWIVKAPMAKSGPGPNFFGPESIRFDESQRQITLALTQKRNRWYSGEIYSESTFSFGEFTLIFSIPSKLDSQLVFGFFLYNEHSPPYYDEIDFEIAEWGDITNYNSQFSIQPYQVPGNATTYNLKDIFIENKIVINWQKEQILFNLFDKYGNEKSSWTYEGNNIPIGEGSRVHMNLWLFQGQKPAENGSREVIIHDFQYKKINDLTDSNK